MSNNIITKNAGHSTSGHKHNAKPNKSASVNGDDAVEKCLKVKLGGVFAGGDYQKTIDEMNVVVERLKGAGDNDFGNKIGSVGGNVGGEMCDSLWLLEYDDVYTIGKMGQAECAADGVVGAGGSGGAGLGDGEFVLGAGVAKNMPISQMENGNALAVNRVGHAGVNAVKSERGGRETYHCVGQRVVYFMCNLRRKYGDKADVRKYVNNLEQVIIDTIADFGVKGFRIDGKVGIWVNIDELSVGAGVGAGIGAGVGVGVGLSALHGGCKFAKIAAIGIKVSRWVCSHGCAVNVNADLVGFEKITPCGIDDDEFGVCSLRSLGVEVSMDEFDKKFVANFLKTFEYSSVVN